ncbi:serine/threonine protein kinase, CMGC, CDC2/CDK sub [Marasmius tenuissimus]|nr:serine/threonine protein kinase, CMGC, CDC2/CDK sub [Marasmius tenuissimus]
MHSNSSNPPGVEGNLQEYTQGGDTTGWLPYQQVKYYTNAFIVRDHEIQWLRYVLKDAIYARSTGIETRRCRVGGKVEPGETSLQAATRELEEEAGIKATLEHAGVLFFLSEGEDKAFHIDIYRGEDFTGTITELTIDDDELRRPSAIMPQFSPLSHSKRKASRSPDSRPFKRQAPSTPEEGEVDDGGPSNPSPHFSLPPKPVAAAMVTDHKPKAKIAFPFKTKKTQPEPSTMTNVLEAKPSGGRSSPGRGRMHERPSEGTRRTSRDSDTRLGRNGDGGGRGGRHQHVDPYYPEDDISRYQSRPRSRSRSMSPGLHRLPTRRSPSPYSPPRRNDRYERNDWRDRHRDDRSYEYRGQDRDRDRGRYRDNDDRHYRPGPYPRRNDDRDYGGRDNYHRRRSPSRGRSDRGYDSYRPKSPGPSPDIDLARTPPGPPPPQSPPRVAETPPPRPQISQQPLPPSADGQPPPPPKTPPPVPPPDARIAHLDKSKPPGLPERPKTKAVYIPITNLPPKPPGAPRDIHSPPPLRDPAPTDKYKGSTGHHSKNTPKEAPPRIRVLKRRPQHPDRKKEEERFGHALNGCGRQDDYEATTKLGEGTFGYEFLLLFFFACDGCSDASSTPVRSTKPFRRTAIKPLP